MTVNSNIADGSRTPADTAAALIISDTFDPILRAPISVTLNGEARSETGKHICSAATGEHSTIDGRVTVPAAPVLWTRQPAFGQLRRALRF